jgi:hypothetical protein
MSQLSAECFFIVFSYRKLSYCYDIHIKEKAPPPKEESLTWTSGQVIC